MADADGLGTLHYQWQRDSGTGFGNVGRDQASYTLGDADVGATMRVMASYTDGHGTAETVTSAATAAVTNVNDAPTGAVSDHRDGGRGPGADGVDTSTLADADGLGTLHYQWQRDSGTGFGNVGLDQARPTRWAMPTSAPPMRVVASYTDGHGTAETVTSAATAAVANVNDAPTGAVSDQRHGDRGPGADGVDTSTLADADGLGTLHYHWQRDSGTGFDNRGATGATYTLGDADVGATIRVMASYTDGHGTAESRDQRGDGGGGQRQRCADRRGERSPARRPRTRC